MPVWTSQLYVNDWWHATNLPLAATLKSTTEGWQLTVQNQSQKAVTTAQLAIGDKLHAVGEVPAGQTKIFQLTNHNGLLIEDLVRDRVRNYQAMIQERQYAFGRRGGGRIDDLATATVVASLIGQVSRTQNGGSFVASPGLDLSEAVAQGHAVLLEALNEIRDRHWHLTCAGSLLRDVPTVAAIQHMIDRLSLRKRVSLLGDLDRDALERQYARADVFVLPSYLEGYGMALAEAVAFGLPVVSTTAGAIPETVPANAGIFVAPGDSRALAKALASVIDDGGRRAALAANARAARAALPTWASAATKFAAALDGLGANA